MKNKSHNSSLLSILLFIVILSLVNSVQNMISPNLEIISFYFGFGGETAQLGVLTSTFTISPFQRKGGASFKIYTV